MSNATEWFSVHNVSSPLEQGVILMDFKYIDTGSVSLTSLSTGEILINEADVIILSQSCDLTNEKSTNIHICPVVSFSDFIDSQGFTSSKGKITDTFKQLSDGRRINKYFTDVCNVKKLGKKFYNDHLVVNFDQSTVVSFEHINQSLNKREFLSLNPPYREAMAQAYGRYFMRVGNPKNIQSINIAKYLKS